VSHGTVRELAQLNDLGNIHKKTQMFISIWKFVCHGFKVRYIEEKETDRLEV
jgi:hypothetical protein